MRGEQLNSYIKTTITLTTKSHDTRYCTQYVGYSKSHLKYKTNIFLDLQITIRNLCYFVSFENSIYLFYKNQTCGHGASACFRHLPRRGHSPYILERSLIGVVWRIASCA